MFCLLEETEDQETGQKKRTEAMQTPEGVIVKTSTSLVGDRGQLALSEALIFIRGLVVKTSQEGVYELGI